MKPLTLLMMALIAILLGGCAEMSVTPETKQALTPAGKLRVGLYRGGPTSIIPGATPDESKGVGHDLGKEMAKRLGVAFEPVVYPSPGALVKGAEKAEWDIAFIAVSPERTKTLSFTEPFLYVEHGYLLPPGSTVTKMEELDQAGMRIGAPQGGSVNAVLKRLIKHATVTNSENLAAGAEMLKKGEVAAFAANKANLYELSDKLPGSRVLPGHIDLDRIGVAVPKGREAGLDYLRDFLASAESEGRVSAAVQRARLRGVANREEVKVMCLTPMEDAMKALKPMFEQHSGHKLAMNYEVTTVLIRRIEAGETFDVTVLLPKQVEALAKKGLVAPSTAAEIARSGLGVGVKTGAPKPDVSTVESFKAALRNAKSIAYSKEGQSGVAFKALIEKLGIKDELAPKLMPTPADEFVTVVPSGKAEMIVVPISVIMAPGMDLAGPVPAEVQTYFVYTAGLGPNTTKGDAGREFINFLRSPAATPILKAKGMEPGTAK